jgi:rubrerythrin
MHACIEQDDHDDNKQATTTIFPSFTDTDRNPNSYNTITTMSDDAAAAAAVDRWVCDACGCHTNVESERSCGICGTARSGE